MKTKSNYYLGRSIQTNASQLVYLTGLILLIFFTTNAFSAKVYNEAGGIVMMEAENTISSLDLWKMGNIAGSSGSGNIEFTGNTAVGEGSQRSPLLYKFKINTAGDYIIHVRGRRSDQFTDTRKDIANDAYIRVEGDYTVGTNGPPDIKHLKEDEKIFVGRGGYQDATGSYDWRWGSKLDIHGLSSQPTAVYRFKAGETYTLVVSGRSTYFAIDRILFVSSTANTQTAQALIIESETFDDGEMVESYSYDAINHFDDLNAGDVPFYKDNIRKALAIDASQTTYRGKYARAQTVFTGKTDKYDVTLTSLLESDGECSYRFLVNGEVKGSFQNERISAADEYKPHPVIFKAVELNNNDIIAVEANSHTNGMIPEGNGTAWARGRWSNIKMSKAIFQGRIAVVADGNYRDPDDIIGTPVSLAILKAFGLEKQLVHYSHSCDLKPGSNDPGGEYREIEMQISCDETAALWGGFEHITFFNATKQQQETINDLSAQINASSETNPIWIIGAGEPDIIWYAVNKSDPVKRKFIYIVSHHPANDVGDFYDLADVMNLGIPNANLHRIPDQNKLLKSPLSDWHWARDHEDKRLQWLWERGVRAQLAENGFPAIVGTFDCSDAGMLYYWATLPSGGDFSPDVPKLKKLFLDYLATSIAK